MARSDIIRYFMTISEAVSLVLQAGAFAKGGDKRAGTEDCADVLDTEVRIIIVNKII